MPQFNPFFFTQELGSALFVVILLTVFISHYVLPKWTVTQAVRRYLVSL